MEQTSTGRPWPGRPSPLGAHFDGSGVNFALWAEGADAVELCLFDEAGAETRLALTDRTHHVFHGYLSGLRPGQRYGYRVHGPWDPASGSRWNPAKLLLDPYARATDGEYRLDEAVYGHVFGGPDTVRDERDSAPHVPRSVVVHEEFDWAGTTRPQTPWGETVLYEAHVRGLTMRHPAVPEQLRGTYAGLAHPAVVEHLRSLGVTAVELLPVHQFVSEEHLLRGGLTNHWGYNTLAFFAPHAGYSAALRAGGGPGSQVREFREMVRDLHAAGLEVILDVVYNHTAEGSEFGPTLSLRGVDNTAYYRLAEGGRRYQDFTGCGNTLNVMHPQVLRLVTDSLRYWVREMGVDGFRFDLASALARTGQGVERLSSFFTAIGQDPVLSEVKLIAEPWDVAAGGYQVGRFPPPWAEWNDRYRDAVRDYWRGARQDVRELAYRLSGSSDLYQEDGRRPYASVNFVTAHDGFTLRDLVSYERKHNEANGESNRDGSEDNRSANHGVEGETEDGAVNRLRRRQVRNMLATLLLSTGVPMLVAGDELGRTQGGNNNAYCQDNEVSWVDWEPGPEWSRLLEFTRELTALRRAHPTLRQSVFFSGTRVWPDGRQDIAWFTPEGNQMAQPDWFTPVRALGMYLSGRDVRERDPRGQRVVDDSFLLVTHAEPDRMEFRLPDPEWGPEYEVVLDTGRESGPRTRYLAGSTIPLEPRSLVLLRVLEGPG